MNTLKKVILGLMMTATGVATCNEEQAAPVEQTYSYWAIGAGIPTALSAKVGWRSQLDHHGYEFGVGLTPLVVIMEGHVFGSYLYYPYPDLKAQTYLGMGLRIGGFLDHRAKFGYVAPGFLLGREYMTRNNAKRFIQVAVGPGGLTTKGFKYWTSISLAFGYAF